MSYLTHLQCSFCGEEAAADRLQTVCASCGKVLFARYDLDAVRRGPAAGGAARARADAVALPRAAAGARRGRTMVTLGEGMTPLLPAPRLGAELGCSRLLIKEEGLNPTGSFKARGQAVAVSRAKELGATSLAVPSAGNAGGALAAYAARAGLPTYVFMPADTPEGNKLECAMYGAHLYLVDGLINDCGRIVRERAAAAAGSTSRPCASPTARRARRRWG